MNRALIAQSFEPRLKLLGSSACDDVRYLQKSLQKLKTAKVFECGDGGTTLRFLAFRVSRLRGTFLLKASASLLKRPQLEIRNILNQLGVEVRFQKNGVKIISEGWKPSSASLVVNAEDSSQFVSALCLNAWNLDFDLKIKIKGKIISESYFTMTKEMLKTLGMKLRVKSESIVIPQQQKIRQRHFRVESDLSSAFSVAAFAAMGGTAVFQQFPENSLQPDKVFINIFKKMKILVIIKQQWRKIEGTLELKPVIFNLQNAPDLFPVLSVLCAFADGESTLFGAPQLIKKESNRIAKTVELLTKAGFACRARNDGITIRGGGSVSTSKAFVFDPAHDHRLAMAAALLKSRGFKIKIKHPEVVNKSFPEFWKCVGVRP